MNPFTIGHHPQYFCDREKEIKRLKANIDNGLNTLIHSHRRLGKTALIQHLFYRLEKSGRYETIFVDLFATSNMEELIKELTESIVEKFYSKNFIEGFKNILKGISATISFTREGTPQIGLQLNENEKTSTLRQLLQYLENRKKKVVLAFDEFQEVSRYPEKAEAILRSHIQHLHQVVFIYSGSTNHILTEMFFSPKRPFYLSTDSLALPKIERKKYEQFIIDTFKKFNKHIETEAVEYLMDFTEGYTYYTQVIANQAFYQTDNVLTSGQLRQLVGEYMESKKTDYQNLLNLLPENQKKVAIAIAAENVVNKPTSMNFIHQYQLPSVSSVAQAVKALDEKEIIYKTTDGFQIYDVFFKRFLQRYYG